MGSVCVRYQSQTEPQLQFQMTKDSFVAHGSSCECKLKRYYDGLRYNIKDPTRTHANSACRRYKNRHSEQIH